MRRVVLGAAGLCLAGWAMAQAPAPPDPATVERMERARREAANPLRMIIEASQVKARAKAADAPAAAPAAAASVPAPAPPRTAERRPAPSPQPSAIVERVEPLPAQPVAAAAVAAPPAAPAPAPASAAAAGPAGVSGTATVAAPTPAAAPVAAPTVGAAAPPAAAPVPPPAAQAPLTLVNYIEPELPQRVRSRLKPNSEVTVAFKVNTDGTVSEVDIRASESPALAAIVRDAVRQWRYAPLPAAREHLVQLVFNLND
ncbi:MAG: TonB family protein [Burkholderiales bacterium]|nr:TonB family protein [Burkholderiales bacterium]